MVQTELSQFAVRWRVGLRRLARARRCAPRTDAPPAGDPAQGRTGVRSPTYRDPVTNLDGSTVPELLAMYASILNELRRRGVVRSGNAPAGDYAEWLVARALDGTLVANFSVPSYDLTLDDGTRIQVKCRLVSAPPTAGQTQTSPFRSWEFDLAALVLLDAQTYQPVLGVLLPVAVVQQHARPRSHVNGHVVFIRPPLLDDPAVIDITDKLREAAGC